MSGIVLAPVSGYKESRDVSFHFKDIYTGADEKDVVAYGSCIVHPLCARLCVNPRTTQNSCPFTAQYVERTMSNHGAK